MGYYVSHMIGIRTGGVFSGDVDMKELKKRVKLIAQKHDVYPYITTSSMSKELNAQKGSYVVMAGVFNYWTDGEDFCKDLSEEFGTEVMHMMWDEESDKVTCNIYLGGNSLFETNENPIGKILRRVS